MANVSKKPKSKTRNQPPPTPPVPSTTSSVDSTAPSTSPSENASSQNTTRATRKKVRGQDVVILDQRDKPVDGFHVRISQVRAQLRVVEPRPVVLAFEFDNFWFSETDVYSTDINPVWRFNNVSIRGLLDSHADARNAQSPRQGGQASSDQNRLKVPYSPDAHFVYETEFGYKLHRKFMIVRLSERSPYGDVEWGSAVVPLDSIARGCEQLSLSIIATDGVTCYGTVYCNVSMTNVQKVRVHLTDLHLSEYPEAYAYDVKLIHLDMGIRPFEDGTKVCTEKRSDAEPRFSAQPALYREASLRELLMSSAMGGPSLKIFFSVRRQVARDRTEEIGMGALPVRMLFAKVAEGWMDAPTKFKVPLSGLKGVVRGKVLLRNIPQFCQLAGADLYNADDVIMPMDVDLDSRKLLPWLKLPRSMEGRRLVPMPCTIAGDCNEAHVFTGGDVTPAERYHSNGQVMSADTSEVKHGEYRTQTASLGAEVGSEDTLESSIISTSVGANVTAGTGVHRDYVQEGSTAVNVPTTAELESSPSPWGGLQGAQDCEGSINIRDSESKYKLQTTKKVENEICVQSTRDNRDCDHNGLNVSWTDDTITDESRTRVGRVGDDDASGNRSVGSKSGKSVGSCGTIDGTVEIGSAVLSQGSDDGFGRGALVDGSVGGSSQGSSKTGLWGSSGGFKDCQVSGVERDGAGQDTDTEETKGDTGEVGLGELDGDEWIAIQHGPTTQYYFVHRCTQESLWLPPNWARGMDDNGYQYFIDHGSRRTQRGFPVVEARAYRDSVFAG